MQKGNTRNRVDWTKWDRFLGTEEDQPLAKRIGCSTRAVGIRRQKLGIPMYGKRVKPNWKKWGALAGQISDRALERESGIGHSAIERYRNDNHIPTCQQPQPLDITDLRIIRHKLSHPEYFGDQTP